MDGKATHMTKKRRREWQGLLAGGLSCIGGAASIALRSGDPLARISGYVILAGGILLLAGVLLNRRRS